jgi:hypothetical protein
MPIGDLPGYKITEVDQKLMDVYGDYIHQNDGSHLDGGILDDAAWQSRWRKLIVLPCQRYDAPSGAVGRRFVRILTEELRGIRSRKWNAERFIVFQAVVLQRSREVKNAGAIKRRLSNRMDAWEAEKYDMLTQDTERAALAQLARVRGIQTPEQRAKTYARLVLQGKLRAAVRWLTEREKGGVLLPDDLDSKTNEPVIDVLRSKHPDARVPDVSVLEAYEILPDLQDVDITEETVEQVARRLSGSAGPGGTDSAAVQHWLLRFGGASQQLRKAVAEFTDWMANTPPPWASYRALRAGRLVALDKCPGVRPVGIGESWMRLISKCVLNVAGGEAKEACGVDQLCVGLESGIEGGIHAMRLLWEQHSAEEEWGFLLVDAANAFNEGNRIAMFWTLRHEWPSGARFAFNCYRHWAILVVRGENGHALFIESKEGVTQGDPLAMAAYGILLLPLIRQLKREIPEVSQPWYADDAGAGGNFDSLRRYFERLQEIGPSRGYFPEPSKSILVVLEHNREKAESSFHDLGFKVCNGSRYLGGYIGDSAAQQTWIEKKTKAWADSVTELAMVAARFPQAAYAGLQKSLQQEWQFLQRVTDGLGLEFSAIALAMHYDFLPALFGVESVSDTQRQLASLPVKFAGLAIPDPTATAETNWSASTVICGHIIAAIRGTTIYRSADHLSVLKNGKAELRKRSLESSKQAMESILQTLPTGESRTIRRGQQTGAWLSLLPSTVNGTELSAQEFRDAVSMRYGLVPPDLPQKCDGCDAPFTLQHALCCKKGGLVISRHNEIRDELIHMAGKAMTPSAIRDEPLIRTGRVAEKTMTCPTIGIDSKLKENDVTGESDRGDLLLRGFWARGTDCIVDVRVTDTDAKSYCKRPPDKVLESGEKLKKKKYLEACLEQRRHFTPFVCSVDGLLGREAQTFAKRLAAKLAKKWQRSYSQTCGYVNARLSIAIIRATHLCLRGSRIPTSKISTKFPQWEDGAGLALFEC